MIKLGSLIVFLCIQILQTETKLIPYVTLPAVSSNDFMLDVQWRRWFWRWLQSIQVQTGAFEEEVHVLLVVGLFSSRAARFDKEWWRWWWRGSVGYDLMFLVYYLSFCEWKVFLIWVTIFMDFSLGSYCTGVFRMVFWRNQGSNVWRWERRQKNWIREQEQEVIKVIIKDNESFYTNTKIRENDAVDHNTDKPIEHSHL